MSGDGAPKLAVSGVKADGEPYRIVVIASQWHTQIMDALIAGATSVGTESGADVHLVRVPGSFELTVAAEQAARSGADGVVTLGVVVRGETPHFDYVCQSATLGLTDVARSHCIPVGFGLLTVDTVQQALDRAGLPESKEDKGAEAMEAVLATLATLNVVAEVAPR